jgi:hypothetical protein
MPDSMDANIIVPHIDVKFTARYGSFDPLGAIAFVSPLLVDRRYVCHPCPSLQDCLAVRIASR